MSTNATAVLERLEGVRGDIITAGHPEYDEARTVYNGMYDDRRPLAIVRARDVADIRATVREAHDSGLDLAIKAGGHSVPGFGSNDGGLVLDLSSMKGIRVDPDERIAQVQPGCVWGDLDHATHAFGLATTGGIISTTGVAGLTLGGGIGYLARAHGLSLDNLRSADVVLADGTFVHTNHDEHPDLFWAIRGGGGNFGVLTSMEFDLHPVDTIYGGPLLFSIEHAADVFEAFPQWIHDAPRAMGAFPAFHQAPPMPFVPEDLVGVPHVIVVTCFNGTDNEAEIQLKALRDVAPVVTEHVGRMPYPALNSAFDDGLRKGLRHYWKAAFVTESNEGVVDAFVEHGPKVPSMETAVHMYAIDGAVHDVPADATAFAFRGADFAAVIAGMWEEEADDQANIQWVRDFHADLEPHAESGAYINFRSEDDQHRVADDFGPHLAKLRRIKKAYDPDNVFHLNQNIAPAD